MNTEQFKEMSLRSHSFLKGIPLHSLDCVELPGGRPGMVLAEISEVVGFGGEAEMEMGMVTNALFRLRGWIGQLLHWDDAKELVERESYLSRLSEEDHSRSMVKPGKVAGISRILYQFENEMLGEIINRTVHCFWMMASERTANGYKLWIAVYVKKLNWFTPVYMALISPLLKWIIYPATQKGIIKKWREACPVNAGTPNLIVREMTK